MKKRSVKLDWTEAPEVKQDIEHILQTLEFSHIDAAKISCYRTQGSTSRSYARIWSFPKIFQQALHIQPHYVIEVLSTYYDRLDRDEQIGVLIHELLHIPKNFSGALLAHRQNGRHLDSIAKKLLKEYKDKTLL
ncbi:MAG: metallopeptidase [Patescibacteria group bacterium]|nr:metallopeptidase [Patescibacteria group bacterium]